ncbi:MAG: hypothetical protein ACTSQA_08015 [Candidatus Heimdallarchaeaceae archaeon]
MAKNYDYDDYIATFSIREDFSEIIADEIETEAKYCMSVPDDKIKAIIIKAMRQIIETELLDLETSRRLVISKNGYIINGR